MSLSFSIDRILSPDFGICKSRVLDSTAHTCSVNALPVDTAQGLCKREDLCNKKLVTDTCKSLEMPPSTEMHERAALLSKMISAFPSHSPNSKFVSIRKFKWDALKNGRTDILTSPDRNSNQHDLESLSILSTSPDYISVKSCSDKQPAPLTKVANFIEDIFDQKVQGLIYEKNFQSSADGSEQASSPKPFRLNLPGGSEQMKPLPGNKAATSSTKETSSPPRKYEDPSIKAPSARDAQSLTKLHLEEDNLQTDETEISCDTKPQVPEELFQSDDRCLSADGRCSSCSSSSESNHARTTSRLSKTSFDETKTEIKESLSDDCVDSPPTNFRDTKVDNSPTSNHKLLSEDLGEIIPAGEGWPVWVYCNRYSARPSSGPRSRRQSRKMQSSDEKRCRTAFTMFQLNKLHMAFESNPYLCEKRRNELARDLELSESQVKIWFQNRRAKVKKATGTKNPLAALLKEQGLYNHSTTKA